MTKQVMVPHSLEAEEAVIGGAMINPGAIGTVSLLPRDFYIHRNGWIWDAILTLDNNKQNIDFITITNLLDERDQLADCGGSAYITQMMSNVPSSLHIEDYAKIVEEKAIRRDTLTKANDLAKHAYSEDNNIIEERGKIARDLTTVRNSEGAEHISDWMDKGYDLLTEVSRNPGLLAGLSTGMPDLDKVFGDGLLPGMNLLIGEPGLGKSILAQQIAVNLVEKDEPGVFYAGEMSWQDMYLRFLADWGELRVSDLRHGDIPFDKITPVMEYLEHKPFWVDDPKNMVTAELRADLTRLKAEHGIKWMVFDYLDDLRDEEGKVEGWKRSEILATRVQDICVDLNIRGLVIHEVNKEGMDNPGMSGIAGGKKVSYRSICAVQILSYVKDGDEEPEDKDIRSIKNIKQNRLVEDGRTWCDLYKDPQYPRFRQLAWRDA